MQVVAVGDSSASSARNPCRPVSWVHAGLQSTYSHTAVNLRLQLYQLRFNSKSGCHRSLKKSLQKQKHSSIQEKSHHNSPLALLLSSQILDPHRGQDFKGKAAIRRGLSIKDKAVRFAAEDA